MIRRLSLRGVRFNSGATAGLKLSKFDEHYTSIAIDGELHHFKNLFLRDSCTSEASVDPFSRQKLFSTGDITQTLNIIDARVNGDNLEVKWHDGESQSSSTFLKDFLDSHKNLESSLRGKFFHHDRLFWDMKSLKPYLGELQVDCSDYNSTEGFHSTLDNLNRFGLSFINSIPKPAETTMTEENAYSWPVAQLANKFGYIKKTFYGTLFDVKNEKEDAKNIANTNTFLPLHMDLLYYESPPGLQFLHFIENSTEGGENVFSDSFLAVEFVKSEDMAAYEALTKFPITFHYDNNGEYYYYTRPLVVEDPLTGVLQAVNYSPPFQGPFELGTTSDSHQLLFNDFLRGLILFESFVNDPANQYKVKMPEGSCVVFDNRRVLHSRLEFSDANGGDRWLMGCYVDGDSYRSRLRIRSRSL